jgi:hypothetical protein
MNRLRLYRTPRELAAWLLALVVLTIILPTFWLRAVVLTVGVGIWIALRLAFDEDRER